MRDVQLVGAVYSGTTRDVSLLGDVLRAGGIDVGVTGISDFHLLPRMCRKLRDLVGGRLGFRNFRSGKFALSVFFQQPHYWWLKDAGFNCVIPNQEWFSEYALRLLPEMNEVWCKTMDAHSIFTEMGCKCRYIGFTSSDRLAIDDVNQMDYGRFLHIGGPSDWRGTQILLKTWLRHPEWPHITILSQTKLDKIPDSMPDNIRLIRTFLPEAELAVLQNSCGMYIQPTEMEGFGHAIVEAMSARAAVIVTDGRPMNEIVNAERGFLIPPARTVKHNLGTRYFVSSDGIEATMEAVLCSSLEERRQRGLNSRNWYIENDAAFRSRILAAVRSIL